MVWLWLASTNAYRICSIVFAPFNSGFYYTLGSITRLFLINARSKDTILANIHRDCNKCWGAWHDDHRWSEDKAKQLWRQNEVGRPWSQQRCVRCHPQIVLTVFFANCSHPNSFMDAVAFDKTCFLVEPVVILTCTCHVWSAWGVNWGRSWLWFIIINKHLALTNALVNRRLKIMNAQGGASNREIQQYLMGANTACHGVLLWLPCCP